MDCCFACWWQIGGGSLHDAWAEPARFLVIVALLFGGFYLAARWGIADLRPLSGMGFVLRPSARQELGIGIALGWGTGLALMLPALLSRNLSFSFHWSVQTCLDTLLALLLVCAFALALQLVLSGLPVRLLVRSIGPTWAVIAVTFLGMVLALPGRSANSGGVIYTALCLCLCLVGFLRTRAIWVSLGLQAGLFGSLLVLFGAPSYLAATPGIIRSDAAGPVWLSGGFAGPEASAFAIPILLVALLVLLRLTKDFAWHYTYQPADPGGMPVEIQPPAAHTREEARTSASTADLVQIGGITTNSATGPVPPSESL